MRKSFNHSTLLLIKKLTESMKIKTTFTNLIKLKFVKHTVFSTYIIIQKKSRPTIQHGHLSTDYNLLPSIRIKCKFFEAIEFYCRQSRQLKFAFRGWQLPTPFATVPVFRQLFSAVLIRPDISSERLSRCIQQPY